MFKEEWCSLFYFYTENNVFKEDHLRVCLMKLFYSWVFQNNSSSRYYNIICTAVDRIERARDIEIERRRANDISVLLCLCCRAAAAAGKRIECGGGGGPTWTQSQIWHRVELIYILYYTNVIPFEKMASLHLHHRQHHIHISCYIRSTQWWHDCY